MAKPPVKVCLYLNLKLKWIKFLTELFIGSLALDESMEGELGNQLRIVFADKPDNCKEVAKEELKSLITAAGDGGSLEEFYKAVDANRDFIVTCNEILEYSFMMLNEIHNDEP